MIYEILKGYLPTNMKTEAMSEDLANELVEAKLLTITKEAVVADKQSALKKANAKGAEKQK